ncbi:PDGLE domain-containing protein [Aeromicrobium flavum]|uniref:PDGLE domain-containing protein n=1 Tax=Aeromicrobium flavum TaxID=416568 RepID=UPI0031E26A42
MSGRRLALAAVAVCLLLAGVVSRFASGHPDGLERVAGDHGFADAAGTSLVAGSPLAGYPGWTGLVGCALVLGLVWGVTRVTAGFTRR